MSVRGAKLIATCVVIAAIAVVIALIVREPSRQLPEEGAAVEELGEGVQSVLLTFAASGASRTIDERREIVVPEDRASRARRILQELAAGPTTEGADPTIPAGTRVNSVVFDDTGGVYVDFSQELVENHPGGSTGELFTIRSIVRTLALNFPDVERVTILVNGDNIETIAGHIDASVPFLVESYR
ncbi:MAG: GerMN domain-containing protein [Candidatus Eisenbacteria bacterium]|nr:GerMN domain-containing protein [Candidatus Eisenbacteria bacterium]